MIVACKIADHLLQRNIYFVTLNFGTMNENKLNPFDLNRTEYASLLGISPNAVRMRMRHGKLEGEYIFKNGKYFFRAPKRERDSVLCVVLCGWAGARWLPGDKGHSLDPHHLPVRGSQPFGP